MSDNSPLFSKQLTSSSANLKKNHLRLNSDAKLSRAWQRMLSGRRLDILNPSPLDIEIEDIAHGLARVNRWNGQTKSKHSLSVAQHSVLVEKLVRLNAPKLEQKWYLAALLHDAPEYVIGDMITPFKRALGSKYHKIEKGLTVAINIRFSLPGQIPNQVERTIKRADRMAAWLEATQLAGFTEIEAVKIFSKPPGTPKTIKIKPQSPEKAKAAFLHRFFLLGGQKKRSHS